MIAEYQAQNLLDAAGMALDPSQVDVLRRLLSCVWELDEVGIYNKRPLILYTDVAEWEAANLYDQASTFMDPEDLNNLRELMMEWFTFDNIGVVSKRPLSTAGDTIGQSNTQAAIQGAAMTTGWLLPVLIISGAWLLLKRR